MTDTNYIWVSESHAEGEGDIVVYDDNDIFNEVFDYSGIRGRTEARQQATKFAMAKAKELGCEWGANF